MEIILNKDYIKLITILLVLYAQFCWAQPSLPQRSITLNPTQELFFGKFYDKGNGGSISVDWQGNRTTSGDTVAVPSSFGTPALFDIKLCQGRSVTITYQPTVILEGSNGGSFNLDIGPTEKGQNGATFATENNCNFITILRVGGTLHIPAGSKSGLITGSFEISFDQQ
jgi:hypothetical protein